MCRGGGNKFHGPTPNNKNWPRGILTSPCGRISPILRRRHHRLILRRRRLHLDACLARYVHFRRCPLSGDDVPEDVAGGLKLATKLSWTSPTRLCILIADAPCHGRMYHGSMRDRYPDGCPSGLNPSTLMYNLKVRNPFVSNSVCRTPESCY